MKLVWRSPGGEDFPLSVEPNGIPDEHDLLAGDIGEDVTDRVGALVDLEDCGLFTVAELMQLGSALALWATRDNLSAQTSGMILRRRGKIREEGDDE